MAKIAYCAKIPSKRQTDYNSALVSEKNSTVLQSSSNSNCLGERLHFIKFETKYIEGCLDFINKNLLKIPLQGERIVKVTGGGAYKFSAMVSEKLGVR